MFIEPVFRAFGFDRDEALAEVYMASAVKCATRDLEEPYRHCRSYLSEEIASLGPADITTTGSKQAKWTARQLGVPSRDTQAIKISKPEWWGLSDFETEPPLIHVPHWSYYNTHHRLSDEQWDEVIQTTQNALMQTAFS